MANQVDILNHLLLICEDSFYGYQMASESVKSEYLKILFDEYSLERESFITQIKSKLTSLGESENNVKSSTNRTSINIKTVLATGDEQAILDECSNNDRTIVEIYEKSLTEDLPHDVKEMIEDQLSKIRSSFNRTSQLDHAP